jgi:hypothetical protein
MTITNRKERFQIREVHNTQIFPQKVAKPKGNPKFQFKNRKILQLIILMTKGNLEKSHVLGMFYIIFMCVCGRVRFETASEDPNFLFPLCRVHRALS